jgi:RNA recognition motif-containing protein
VGGQAEPTLAAELKEDVAAECAKIGPIERLKMFQGNPEGVMSVRFKMEEAAEECIKLMNGRFFGGRRIVAHKFGEPPPLRSLLSLLQMTSSPPSHVPRVSARR